MKHPKQKEDSDSYEIGDLVESPTRNVVGEIVAFHAHQNMRLLFARGRFGL